MSWHCREKLGKGEQLSLEAYKFKENNMLHKEHVNFYQETHFYRHNFSIYEVMAEGIIANAFQCSGCERLPNFDLLIISSFIC